METLEPLYSTEDAAKFFKVDVVTIRRLVSRGELNAYRVAGEYRFSKRDLQEYLQRQRVAADGDSAPNQTKTEVWQDSVSRFSFSKAAHQALQFASEEARAFQHPYIGPEHILLGLMRVPDGVAARMLNELGGQPELARKALEAVVGRGEGEADQALDLTTSMKRMFPDLQKEAQIRSHPAIGTEHLLSWVVRSRERVILHIMEHMGLSMEALRARIDHHRSLHVREARQS